MKSSSAGSALALVLALGRCAPVTHIDSPNLVVVTIDTLRADRLGLYGYFRDTTPFLDSLAEESLVFERCLAPMATTYPSHLSLFTGTYPEETGAVANARVGGLSFIPTERLRSLAQILGEGGYRTAAFIGAAPLKRHSGLDAGFDVFDEPALKQRRAERTNDRVERWLAERDDRPFFLWVHYFDPHTPYRAPEPFRSRFQEESGQQRYLSARGIKDNWAATNNLYDGEVSYVDHELRRLVSGLKARGEIWKRTVLVVVGDHGEALGQHDESQHGGVWTEQLQVPLLVRIPGMARARIDRPLSVADVVPTLLGLIELPGEEEFLRQASGVDRLASDESPFILSEESSAPWKLSSGASGPRYVLTGEEWKLIYDADGDRPRPLKRPSGLFRISEDPYELVDVREDHEELAASLERRLLELVERQKRRRTELLEGRPPEDSLDPEILDQLRSLGYVK
jgi:arylsulfatase A-like enzyme